MGAVGTIACGWATSKFFKGRCAPMNVICMFLCGIGVLLCWMVGGIANGSSWDAAMLSVAIGAIIGVLLCATLIPSEKRMARQ